MLYFKNLQRRLFPYPSEKITVKGFTHDGPLKTIVPDTADNVCESNFACDACNPNAHPDHSVHRALLSTASAGFHHSADLQPTAPPPLCCLWLSDPQNAR